jgi:hypothetical protein
MVDQVTDPAARWGASWADILEGGQQKWKDGEQLNNFATVYELLSSEGCFTSVSNVLVPLCGDCPFSKYAYEKGHSVCCVDAVEAALDKLKKDFNGVVFNERTSDGTRISTSDDSRVQIYCGDFFACAALQPHKGSINVVYDKDAFGAIDPSQREAYARVIGELAAPQSYVFVEGKSRSGIEGPPFNLDEMAIREIWGKEGFHLVKHFPELYPLSHPSWKQQGFLLQRKSSL